MPPSARTSRTAAELPVEAVPPGLIYVSDERPGIRRLRKGDGFMYRRADGKAVRDAAELQRIRKLAIPPAYENVWICANPRGHLQATGRDARGRKQYRYHADWRIARDADKFERMLEFGRALPRIRRSVAADLAAPVSAQPKRESVLAALIRLRLRFRGKSGVAQEVALEDPRVAKVVRRCQAMPGQELFQYEDETGATHTVDSADVNDYIREAGGTAFTAKDFRTWHGTVQALSLWAEQMAADAASRLSANQVLAEVARRLGNTVAVCKKAYVHPRVLAVLAAEAADETSKAPEKPPARHAGLTASERQLLAFLKDAA